MRTVLLFVALVSVTGIAVAQRPPNDDEAARRHFEAGRAYYDRAQYEDAAHEFDEAYRLSLRPALLLNVSRALEGAGRFADAAAAVQRFLDTAAPDDPDREGTDARLARLRASAARMQHASTNASHVTRPPPAARPAPVAPVPHGLSDTQIVGIVTGAAGVLVAVAGLIVGVVADGIYHHLNATCVMSLCPPDAQSDIDTGSAEAGASSMLLGVAIVAVATGVLLLAFGGTHAEPAPPPAAPPAHHAGPSIQWRASGPAVTWDL